MSVNLEIGRCRLGLVRGDITQQTTDAIVNAANPTLLGGGGVDGAIHRAGGPAILGECRKIVAEIGRCPTGEAVITGGGNLKARHVIHTVGPVWNGGGQNESALLEGAYRNSLRVAVDNGIKTISFPSISTGAYRFPIDRAADIALNTVADFVKNAPLNEVRFVLFSQNDFDVYRDVLSRLS